MANIHITPMVTIITTTIRTIITGQDITGTGTAIGIRRSVTARKT